MIRSVANLISKPVLLGIILVIVTVFAVLSPTRLSEQEARIQFHKAANDNERREILVAVLKSDIPDAMDVAIDLLTYPGHSIDSLAKAFDGTIDCDKRKILMTQLRNANGRRFSVLAVILERVCSDETCRSYVQELYTSRDFTWHERVAWIGLFYESACYAGDESAATQLAPFIESEDNRVAFVACSCMVSLPGKAAPDLLMEKCVGVINDDTMQRWITSRETHGVYQPTASGWKIGIEHRECDE